MRLLLIPAQLGFFLTFLFTADFLQTAAVSTCRPCVLPEYGVGLAQFTINLLAGDWGTTTFGRLIAPATQFLAWWLPGSIELAVVALALSVGLAYPLGMLAGWFGGRPVDLGVRSASLAMLFLPTFLVILLFISAAYGAFYRGIGDVPYGLTPSVIWWSFHGGAPAWIGPAGATEPSGFPLVDGAWHAAWGFEFVTLVKTLLQAATIALVFTPLFLRHLRSAILELPRELFVQAARARGVPERQLLWTHGGAFVFPYFLVALGAAFPVYVGTQILTELIYNDTSLGTMFMLLLATGHLDGFPTVLVLLLALLLLLSGIFTGAAARYRDRRLLDAGT
jgi:peptide/nickel transport system permease protein